KAIFANLPFTRQRRHQSAGLVITSQAIKNEGGNFAVNPVGIAEQRIQVTRCANQPLHKGAAGCRDASGAQAFTLYLVGKQGQHQAQTYDGQQQLPAYIWLRSHGSTTLSSLAPSDESKEGNDEESDGEIDGDPVHCRFDTALGAVTTGIAATADHKST